MKGLSEKTSAVVRKMFPPIQHEEAARLLAEECGKNLPLFENASEAGIERVQLAVLKLSGRNLNRLRQAIDGAKVDWRDTLMAAGFGLNVLAHQEWAESCRSED